MYEKAGDWDKALWALRTMPKPASYDWAVAYRKARIDAARTDYRGAYGELEDCKAHGMTSLGAVRMDPGFAKILGDGGWPEFEKQYESGR
jgi:hypothetical protein